MQQPDVSAVLFVATHDAARSRFFSHDQTACSESFSRENSVALSRSVAQLQACARERGLDVGGRAGRLHGLDGPVDYTGAHGMVGCSKGPGSNHPNRSSCVAQPLVARTAQSQGEHTYRNAMHAAAAAAAAAAATFFRHSLSPETHLF
jgi:hypothetical protein